MYGPRPGTADVLVLADLVDVDTGLADVGATWTLAHTSASLGLMLTTELAGHSETKHRVHGLTVTDLAVKLLAWARHDLITLALGRWAATGTLARDADTATAVATILAADPASVDRLRQAGVPRRALTALVAQIDRTYPHLWYGRADMHGLERLADGTIDLSTSSAEGICDIVDAAFLTDARRGAAHRQSWRAAGPRRRASRRYRPLLARDLRLRALLARG